MYVSVQQTYVKAKRPYYEVKLCECLPQKVDERLCLSEAGIVVIIFLIDI